MKRTGSAIWQGGLKEGKGQLTTQSGVLSDSKYGFQTRFEEEPGTNPEELIAAAHAGCFSMALSMILGEADLTPDKIDTKAHLTLEKTEDGFSITRVHLDVTARVPGADQAQFEELAQKAKVGCPVSRVLKAEITMDAKLES
ncbi:OsmC family protein [Marinobacter sp. OP 3.4]|uniref:OsmC family protein n=1 Tax=Marinobacter sp. OP 3.4 TaxID=3076501 RepID=UPI002E1AE1AC